MSQSTNQYLSFQLDSEIFAIEISKVREVLDYTHITRVPRSPEVLLGVINLRGNVVPIIDLRRSLGISAIEDISKTCIIITEIYLENEILLLGALADSVNEVISLNQEQINPAPKIGTHLNTEYLEGMARINEEFIILLNIDKVLTQLEIVAAQQLISSATQDSET